MHIAVFEVLGPIHGRTKQRLGRRYTVGFEATRLTVQRCGPVRPSSVHVEDFATHEDLLVNVKDKLKRRIYHGYALIWWSGGFPLLPWFRDHACPVAYRAIVPPGIQLALPLPD